MDPVDLHAWAMRNLKDPELGEAALAVRDCINENLEQSNIIELARQLVDEPPTSAQFFVVLERLSRYIRATPRKRR